MTEDRGTACMLISASCVTSWRGWIHGELWLCPTGLLRRSVGLLATLSHAERLSRTVDPSNRPTRIFEPNEIAQILASNRGNRWITWSEISHATLKDRLGGAYELQLELGYRRRERFLWLGVDGGHDLLAESLARSLPGRFEAL